MSVAAIPAVRAETGAAKPPKKVLDQSDFLALMAAQLKNQDPTKPVDNTEYVAQMAQFSAVSGIAQSNSALAAIIERLDALIAFSKPAAPVALQSQQKETAA